MFMNKLRGVMGIVMALACLIGVGSAVVLGQQPETTKAAPAPKPSDTREAAIKAMQERFQGTWKLVALHNQGVKTEPDLTCTIKENAWETSQDGQILQSGTFKFVDLDASPKQIDWVVDSSVAEGDKGKTLHGIFMINGDSLIVVHTYDRDQSERPVTFFTQPGDGCWAAMYKRVATK